MEFLIVLTFIIGYLAIASEQIIKINKTATALVAGVVCWTLFALSTPAQSLLDSRHYLNFAGGITTPIRELFPAFVGHELSVSLSSISSILFFLIGAMTIVELIDAHDGFRIITDRIKTRNLRKLLWIICWTTFFLSAFLDNLTTAIVMVTMTRKLISDKSYRLIFAGMIIIAANAGGAWSPIGDVTTTMLWIGDRISAAGIITGILLPSMVCLLIPLVFLTFRIRGELKEDPESRLQQCSNGGKIMFIAGIGALIFVPVFKTLTHLPPYMGMLLGLGLVWIVSELINPEMDELERQKYSVSHALSRIDISSVLFFFGILLAVGALESLQTLDHFSSALFGLIGDNRIIVSVLGILSAIVDNVPLVAASMGMFSIDNFPTDHMLWEYLAYCSGTGGSLLIIGSAAGVAVMGMEKINFMWYLKNVSMLALAGYIGGALVYLFIQIV